MSTGRFLIINAFSSRNAGDAAIVLATARLLRRNGADMVMSATRYHVEDQNFYMKHGITTTPAVIPFPPRSPGESAVVRSARFAAGAAVVLGVAWLFGRSPRTARALSSRLQLRGLATLFDCEGAIICGGGYLYSSRRRVNLSMMHACLCVRVCELANRSPVMMPQSLGPFTRRSDRKMVAWGLARISPLVVRDEESLRIAREMADPKQEIRLCPDVGLLGWPVRRLGQMERANSARAVVGIIPMDWTWARAVDHRALTLYIERLATLSCLFAADGMEVQLYAHSQMPEINQDDLEMARRVAGLAAHRSVVVDPSGASGDVDALAECFETFALLVGTRLHSCIIGLALGTPSIALAYQPKTTGTYRQLGLSRLCFDVQRFDPEEVGRLGLQLMEEGKHLDELRAAVSASQQAIERTYRSVLRT